MQKNGQGLRVFVMAATAVTSHAWAEQIDRAGDLRVCGVASADAGIASAIDAQDAADVLVLEANAAGSIELVKHLRARLPHAAIIIVGDASTSDDAARLLRGGVRGFIVAHEPASKLVTAIRAVAAGGVYLSDVVTNRLLMGTIGLATEPADSPLARLSDRETSVFRMLGDGLSVREIADKLYLSPKTVESHREHIKQKLQLRNSRELLRLAIRVSIKGS
jgi:DNA-binding NarL/FixJ family response regulator